MEFRKFFLEILDPSMVPKESNWIPPLESSSNFYDYYYKVSGDSNKLCPWMKLNSFGNMVEAPNYCNVARFKLSGNNILDISFIVFEKMYRDLGGGLENASERLSIVLNAVLEFIKKKNPNILKWNARKKTDSDNNLDARKNIYFMMSARHLFPKYVPVSEVEWVRKNVLSNFYPDVVKNDPSIFETVNAKEFLSRVKSIISKSSDSENEREKQDSELNHQNINVGDMVIVNYQNIKNAVGKVMQLQLKNRLMAKVSLNIGQTVVVPIAHINLL